MNQKCVCQLRIQVGARGMRKSKTKYNKKYQSNSKVNTRSNFVLIWNFFVQSGALKCKQNEVIRQLTVENWTSINKSGGFHSRCVWKTTYV